MMLSLSWIKNQIIYGSFAAVFLVVIEVF